MPDRVLADINALAIQLVDDHPGHPYVAEALEPALTGQHTLVVFGYQPFRVQWVLEDLGISAVDARNAVTSLLQYPMTFTDIDRATIRAAYEISAQKNHDVYDCVYLAVARQADVDAICTTDTDFESLCSNEPFAYRNPVPDDVLEQFQTAGR